MSGAAHYTAIPLADRGFIPTGERNPVRWYVAEDGRDWPVVGPFKDQDKAELYAADMNGDRALGSGKE